MRFRVRVRRGNRVASCGRVRKTHLEDEEGRQHLIQEEVPEGGDGDLEHVRAPFGQGARQHRVRMVPCVPGVLSEGLLCAGHQLHESLLRLVVVKLLLAKIEARLGHLVVPVSMDESTDFGPPRVLYGFYLDGIRARHGVGAYWGVLQEAVHLDHPV
eukprot:9122467-Pyramimonas_sp.AAC.1